MARIDQAKIQEILNKTDILDVVGEQVSLSKKGKSYFGLCPFHDEKTPSFSVEPNKKIFNCFSCGEKGNAITFLQKTKNMHYLDALRYLADQANVTLDINNEQHVNPHQGYYDINQEAMQFYQFYLSSTKTGNLAKNYLKDRGITDDIITTFHLGLAPDDFDLLTKTLVSKDYVEADLIDLGLVKQSQKESFYDLFRKRIMFPIIDDKNRVLAFSGRIYQGEENQPKYINSPQSDIFTKSNVIYNLNNALSAIKKHNRVILLEGYMDVIALYRVGIKEAVASMGTSLTTAQVKLLKRYTNDITICYDGDAAGLDATSRAIDLLIADNFNVKVVLLKDGLDPDDYIKIHSKDALIKAINETWLDALEFKYFQYQSNTDLSKMLEIEKFKKDVFDLIKELPHTTIDRYLDKLSSDANLKLESIKQDFIQYTKRQFNRTKQQLRSQIKIDSKYKIAERKLINYFIEDVKYLHRFHQDFGDLFFIDQVTRDIRHAIEDLYYFSDDPDYNSVAKEELYHALEPHQITYFENHIEYKKELLSDDEFFDFIETLKAYEKKMKIEEYTVKIQEALTKDEKIALAVKRRKLKEDSNG
ncbi:MAG: DNA primase [Candidatus Izimaplasma sp.]|nr:DNA primase [Candidatus Izimaplasma bacterium]